MNILLFLRYEYIYLIVSTYLRDNKHLCNYSFNPNLILRCSLCHCQFCAYFIYQIKDTSFKTSKIMKKKTVNKTYPSHVQHDCSCVCSSCVCVCLCSGLWFIRNWESSCEQNQMYRSNSMCQTPTWQSQTIMSFPHTRQPENNIDAQVCHNSGQLTLLSEQHLTPVLFFSLVKV